jgi:hypothetical protein
MPSVTPDSAVHHVYLHGSDSIGFTVIDPDSNLFQCSTWVALPSPKPLRQTVLAPKTSTAHFSRAVFADSLGIGSFVFFAQATDNDLQTSPVVACTVKVVDTVPPVIQVLPPFNNSAHVVTNLPVMFQALVTDDSPIDSVKFNASAMARSGDTVRIEITTLHSPADTDTVVAWDHGGVSDTAIVTFNYTGPVKYPPQVRPMSRTVAEGGKIDTIWLDTCVTLTLPAAEVPNPVPYKRDSLTWQVTGESGLFAVSLNSLTHKVFIALPDTELRIGQAVSEVITFRVTDDRGESDQEFGAFVMTGVNSAPVVNIYNQSVCYDYPFDTLLLDTCFKDAEDTAGSAVEWEFTGGKVFMAQKLQTCSQFCLRPPLGTCHFICFPNGLIAIVPDPAKINPDTAVNWRGTDSLYFRVKDTDGTWSAQKLVTFTRRTTFCFIKQPPIFTPTPPPSLGKAIGRE